MDEYESSGGHRDGWRDGWNGDSNGHRHGRREQERSEERGVVRENGKEDVHHTNVSDGPSHINTSTNRITQNLAPPTPISIHSAHEDLAGTDSVTGINPHDAKFPTLLLHSDHLKPAYSAPADPPKNYRVLFDPENAGHKAKNPKSGQKPARVFRFNGTSVSDPENYGDLILHSVDVADPRQKALSSYFSKPNKNSKKFPFKQLPQPRFAFDKNLVGPPPQTELVVWDIPTATNEVYVTNFFRAHGKATEIRFLQDPMYAVPLGVMVFKFQGSPDKATVLAKNLLQHVQQERPKINGVELKIELNDHDGKLLRSKVEGAQARIRQAQRERERERERDREREREKERERERQRAKERESSREQAPEDRIDPRKPVFLLESDPVSAYRADTTVMSVKYRNKVIPGSFLPAEVRHIIRTSPYLFIHDKHVSTRSVSAQDIKRALNKYGWTRVVWHKQGFFVVFPSLEECKRCFWREDGRRFYEFRMFMEMALPQGFENGSTAAKQDAVEEATNMLVQELHTFLTKDIRERIIAPQVLELLNADRFPVLKSRLDAERAEKERILAAKAVAEKSKPKPEKEDRKSLFGMLLPSFKRKEGTKTTAKKRVIPMQHVLNYNESDESDEESSRSATPGPKRERSLPATSWDDEPKKKKKRTLLLEVFDESSENEVTEPEDEAMAEAVPEPEDDFGDVDVRFRPTLYTLVPVYEEAVPEGVDFDLNFVQNSIKDDEDLLLARQVLAQQAPADLSNVAYWAWSHKQTRAPDEIADSVHLIEPLAPKFESSTGCFRSDGYRKIADADKGEYLPHRRRVDQPVKTVQHDGDDHSNAPSSTTVASSRVNRANNRRFVADISAQKQMLGSETDILDLNALAKRKKPVTFARSAIHNWGLYALEPIAAREMIIEYVGESIRQQVAEHREKSYLKTGIGSSYLFRVDENSVIDATKKGGIARFINHCCNPSCTAKIIKVEGKKRIVIYALRDIDANEELTYDYKFERETNDDERIRCLCGAPGCKGYLN